MLSAYKTPTSSQISPYNALQSSFFSQLRTSSQIFLDLYRQAVNFFWGFIVRSSQVLGTNWPDLPQDDSHDHQDAGSNN